MSMWEFIRRKRKKTITQIANLLDEDYETFYKELRSE